MFEPLTTEETVHYYQLRSRYCELWTIETKCFHLEQRLSRIERKWPGRTAEEQHRMRRERNAIRHELEMLKIDFHALRQRAAPLLKAPSE